MMRRNSSGPHRPRMSPSRASRRRTRASLRTGAGEPSFSGATSSKPFHQRTRNRMQERADWYRRARERFVQMVDEGESVVEAALLVDEVNPLFGTFGFHGTSPPRRLRKNRHSGPGSGSRALLPPAVQSARRPGFRSHLKETQCVCQRHALENQGNARAGKRKLPICPGISSRCWIS